jgi:hypothetical protein
MEKNLEVDILVLAPRFYEAKKENQRGVSKTNHPKIKRKLLPPSAFFFNSSFFLSQK